MPFYNYKKHLSYEFGLNEKKVKNYTLKKL